MHDSRPLVAAPAAAPPQVSFERSQIPGWISFISERHGNRDVFLIRPDGTTERRITHGAEADYNGPATPLGDALLLTSATEVDGKTQQWFSLYTLPAGPLVPLGPKKELLRSPSWGRPGSAKAGAGPVLYFESDSSGFRDLYRINRDGSGLRRLTENPEGNFEPQVSPKGDQLVFVSSRDRRAELYSMSLGAPSNGSSKTAAAAQKRLTETQRDEWAPIVSPDGRWIVFGSDRDGADRLYRMEAGGGPAKRVSAADLDPSVIEEAPRFRPDSKGLLYVTRRAGEPGRIMFTEVESALHKAAVPLPMNQAEPAWSPDGESFVFTGGQGETQLYLTRVKDGATVQLTTGKGPNWHGLWVVLLGQTLL